MVCFWFRTVEDMVSGRSESVKLSKLEYCTVIFFHLKGMKVTQIYEEMKMFMVKCAHTLEMWKRLLKCVWMSLKDKPSAKIMLSDYKGIILTDYITYRYSVNGTYYKGLLEKFCDVLKVNHNEILTEEAHLLVDNASIHEAQDTMNLVQSHGYQLISHPPYTPNLMASDDFLFPKMKHSVKGRYFSSDVEVIFKVKNLFSSQYDTFHKDRL